MSETELPSGSKCPWCRHALELASGAFEPNAKPKPGDFTICIKCGKILRFRERLALGKLEYQDLEEIDADPQLAVRIRTLTLAHRAVMRQHARRN